VGGDSTSNRPFGLADATRIQHQHASCFQHVPDLSERCISGLPQRPLQVGKRGLVVWCKAAPAEEKTAGGIYIPDTAKEKPQQGKVVAVGNGTKDITLTVSVGDEVLYGKYAGTELNVEGKDYLMMRESDILAIV